MQEEPFVPIAPFENFDEVIMRANSLPYGLASYVFTCSPAIVTRASEALDVGTVGVNDLLLANRLGNSDYLDAKHTKLKFA